MKKFLVITMSVLMTLFLVGCWGTPETVIRPKGIDEAEQKVGTVSGIKNSNTNTLALASRSYEETHSNSDLYEYCELVEYSDVFAKYRNIVNNIISEDNTCIESEFNISSDQILTENSNGEDIYYTEVKAVSSKDGEETYYYYYRFAKGKDFYNVVKNIIEAAGNEGYTIDCYARGIAFSNDLQYYFLPDTDQESGCYSYYKEGARSGIWVNIDTGEKGIWHPDYGWFPAIDGDLSEGGDFDNEFIERNTNVRINYSNKLWARFWEAHPELK